MPAAPRPARSPSRARFLVCCSLLRALVSARPLLAFLQCSFRPAYLVFCLCFAGRFVLHPLPSLYALVCVCVCVSVWCVVSWVRSTGSPPSHLSGGGAPRLCTPHGVALAFLSRPLPSCDCSPALLWRSGAVRGVRVPLCVFWGTLEWSGYSFLVSSPHPDAVQAA